MDEGRLHWVFAYGSNMHMGDLGTWLEDNGYPVTIAEAERASLAGYRLIWNYFSKRRSCGAANIVQDENSVLHGVALRVSTETLLGIDAKEGHPRIYERGKEFLRCELASGRTVDTQIYIARPEHCSLDVQAPSAAYLNLLIDGATAFGLPEAHLIALRAVGTHE